MPKSRPPYPPEFRQRIIELVRRGRTPESLAEQFEPSAQTIRNWLAQADRDAGQRPDGLTTDEREELRRLRRENKTLREEREILRKAREAAPSGLSVYGCWFRLRCLQRANPMPAAVVPTRRSVVGSGTGDSATAPTTRVT